MEYKKIKSIKKIGKKRVYNLNVIPNHNFFLSNGILSHNCLDCQSASETRGILSGSDDIMLIFKTTAFRDKFELTDELKRENRMRPDQVADLAFLEKGCCYLAETGRNVQKVQIILPRTMYWKKEYGNFYKNVWPKYGGEWKMTEEIKDKIDERCEERHDALMPKKKEVNVPPKHTPLIVPDPTEDDLSEEKDDLDDFEIEEELIVPKDAMNTPQNPQEPFSKPIKGSIEAIPGAFKHRKKKEDMLVNFPEVAI